MYISNCYKVIKLILEYPRWCMLNTKLNKIKKTKKERRQLLVSRTKYKN